MFPQKIAVKILYDNNLAHLIEAGADMFLMPSHYEPCGLNQIYKLGVWNGFDCARDRWAGRHYRTVGSEDWKRNGLQVQRILADAMLNAVHAANNAFKDQEGWKKLMRNGMKRDFSWVYSAKEYAKVYERAKLLKTPI